MHLLYIIYYHSVYALNRYTLMHIANHPTTPIYTQIIQILHYYFYNIHTHYINLFIIQIFTFTNQKKHPDNYYSIYKHIISLILYLEHAFFITLLK